MLMGSYEALAQTFRGLADVPQPGQYNAIDYLTRFRSICLTGRDRVPSCEEHSISHAVCNHHRGTRKPQNAKATAWFAAQVQDAVPEVRT